MLILQTTCGHGARHCPSLGRMGDLWRGSRGGRGRRRCRCRLCGGCVLRSVVGLAGCSVRLYSTALQRLKLLNLSRLLLQYFERRSMLRKTNMLVDEQNSNVLPLARKLVEGGLNRCGFSLRVYDKEVFLRVWWVGDMLFESVFVCSHLRRGNAIHQSPQARGQ